MVGVIKKKECQAKQQTQSVIKYTHLRSVFSITNFTFSSVVSVTRTLGSLAYGISLLCCATQAIAVNLFRPLFSANEPWTFASADSTYQTLETAGSGKRVLQGTVCHNLSFYLWSLSGSAVTLYFTPKDQYLILIIKMDSTKGLLYLIFAARAGQARS